MKYNAVGKIFCKTSWAQYPVHEVVVISHAVAGRLELLVQHPI